MASPTAPNHARINDDHTTLAEWVGAPLPLDDTVLDPPGQNKDVPRFGKDHF